VGKRRKAVGSVEWPARAPKADCTAMAIARTSVLVSSFKSDFCDPRLAGVHTERRTPPREAANAALAPNERGKCDYS
jgi:hypothetical protein